MKTAIKIVIAILLGCTTAFSNAQNLEENARVKIKKLKEMVESAQKRGIYTEREQMTLRTAGLFLTWANWDEAHVDKNEAYYKSLPYFEPKADSLAKVLPNYERSEVNAILDDAIERLSKVLDGTYTRKSVPKVDYSKARLKNNVILANGRPVFLADHIWKPSIPEFTEFYGALDGALISPSLLNENGHVDAAFLQKLDEKADSNIGQVFLGQGNLPKWAIEKYKDITVGSRHFGKYDVDNPGARDLYSDLFRETIPRIASKNYSGLGYMLYNEPSFFTAEDVWNTGVVSNFTKEKFKNWLKMKHRSIDALNTLWGTNFASFEDVTITIPIAQNKQGSPIWYDWCTFNNYRITDWFRFLTNEISRYDPYARYHIKLMPWLWTGDKKDHGIDFESLIRLCNICGCDADANTGNIRGNPDKWKERYSFEWMGISMMYDFFKSVAPDQIILDSETHFLSSVSFRDVDVRPDYVRACYWLAHVHGLCASENWYWVRDLDGSVRKAGSDYPGSNNQQPAVLNEMHATMIDLNSFSNEITKMQQLRKPLRIYYSLANAINRKEYMEDVYKNYESVFFEGIPLGFATDGIIREENPADWDAILVWKTESVTNQEFDDLQSYLDQGGTVFMDRSSFKTDEYGRSLSPLKESIGKLVFVSSLEEMRQLSLAHVAQCKSLPAITIQEQNKQGEKGCVWRCVKNEKGNYVVSIINLGKTAANLKIKLHNAEVVNCRDIIDGIEVSSTPVLNPKQVCFVEISEK